jgi:cytoskeleton protein RodZ
MNNNENNGLSSEKLSEELSESQELSDDMEMVSPGVMLREAREKIGLTQDDIANRLNFKVSLVESIEQDDLDPLLPITFNRGYLSSYAKVVSVEIEDVLASHDALGAAYTQRSELQSFSNLTIKEAEHSRVMWLSYLIIAILVGLTVLWWLQEKDMKVAISKATPVLADTTTSAPQALRSVPLLSEKKEVTPSKVMPSKVATDSPDKNTNEKVIVTDKINVNVNNTSQTTQGPVIKPRSLSVEQSESLTLLHPNNDVENDNSQLVGNDSAHAVFTFTGDCWVNIYDATGERVAWGVKESGYIMTVKGKAPLRVTLGKPELATILFNDKTVDMSDFNVGNIAKFTLPLMATSER